jgi:methionine--tRNA ligase beta chain
MISIDNFREVDLRIARVVGAEKVSDSEKLVRLEVELDGEKRQIIAGIGRAYSVEQLIGRQIVIVANLEPKELMGLTSEGMVLAADGEEGPVLIVPEKEVRTGTKIK